MKHTFSGTYKMIPRQLLRKAGYHEFIDPNTRKTSYSRILRAGVYYPRFHVYIKMADDGFIVDLHLDQKQASYKGAHAHNAEYDGDTVTQEMNRIVAVINTFRMP